MKGTYFSSNNCEVLASKLVKPKISPHTSMVAGLKIYENVLKMIKKFSNDECFFQEARQAYLSGKSLFGKQQQDSVETIWNNFEKNLKQVGVEIGGLNQIMLGAIKNMRQQMGKLEVAKKSRKTAIVVLHNMTVKKIRSKEKQLTGTATTQVEKKELEKVRLNLKEMLNINFFLTKMNQRHSAGFSFFGVTTKFKSRENTFFQKKKLVLEIQKNIQENTNSLILLRKKQEAKRSLYESLKCKTFTAGQAFKTFVITILKQRCTGILQKLGILEKDLPAVRASLLKQQQQQQQQQQSVAAAVVVKSKLKPLPLQQVHVQEVGYCTEDLFGDSDSDSDVAAEPDSEWFYQESDSDSEAKDAEVVEEPYRCSSNNIIFDGEKTKNRFEQEEYHNRVFASKRPRSTPISVLPSAKRVKTHNIHEVFQNLLTLVGETFPTHHDDDDDGGNDKTNKPTNSGLTKRDYDLANYRVDKINEELIQSYAEEYANLSDSSREKYSEVFSTANDIQLFQRRRRLMRRRKAEKKREKEACESSDDDDDYSSDSDLSCTSSDDDDEETMNELSNLWDLDPATRTERLTYVLDDSDTEETLVLPSDVAATVHLSHVGVPFEKKNSFLKWEEGNPNAGVVLDEILDMVSYSTSLPPMIPYNGLIFNRFCKVCCRVVDWPDVDCICTDYRGLKRSHCKDNLFFPTLRMRNAWIILKRNVRRDRKIEHKAAWRLWRSCQRDLLLWGHPVLRTKEGFENDPRVGNHVLDFMRFVFANYTNDRYGNNDCVVCGDVLDTNRSFNFCNTCKAWAPFQAIWKMVQAEVKPKGQKAISRQHRLAHKHNRNLKKKAEKRQKKYLKTVFSAGSSSSSTTTSNVEPKPTLSPETMEKMRRFARSSGKQPQKLAFKSPKACHLLTFHNNSSSGSSSSSSNSDDDDDEDEDVDPNNRYAVPSSVLPPVNPLDVISFQIPSPPPKEPEAVAVASKEILPPPPPQIIIEVDDSTPTYPVNDYEDDAMAMDFN